jgi:hypothetical protein
VVADTAVEEAFRGFKERYSHIEGIRSVDLGIYEYAPCITATVDEGFGSDRLPAAFIDLPIVIDDGTPTYPATGDPFG